MTAPTRVTDNLYRGLVGGLALRQLERADDDAPADGSLMHGHFAVFDEWNEIDSWFEGRFLERNAPGMFKKTMREQRDAIRVQYDHGHDFFVGGSPLGAIDVLREDDEGAYYEVPLVDTDYNRDRVLPLLRGQLMDGRRAGTLLGASYRFRVTREEWVEPKKASDLNPDMLPERTIREVRLFEFGPVVFPAAQSASAKVRCLTDHYLEKQRARFPRPADLVPAGIDATGTEPPDAPATAPPDEGTRGKSLTAVRSQLIQIGVSR
jgi:HK97 family phage prohead protease